MSGYAVGRQDTHSTRTPLVWTTRKEEEEIHPTKGATASRTQLEHVSNKGLNTDFCAREYRRNDDGSSG